MSCPQSCRVGVSAPTAIDGRQTTEGFCSCFIGRRGVCGDAITLNRTVGPAGVLIEPSQTESLRHPAGRHHAVSDESTGHTGQHPERDQVEAIVFEDWCQAAGIAAAEKANVSRRDLSPRHVPDSMETEYIPLETHETTFVSLPEPPAGVQQVNVPGEARGEMAGDETRTASRSPAHQTSDR